MKPCTTTSKRQFFAGAIILMEEKKNSKKIGGLNQNKHKRAENYQSSTNKSLYSKPELITIKKTAPKVRFKIHK